jgi:hypothetical protein
MSHLEQKGFVQKKAGGGEHTPIANAIINYVVEKKSQFFILSLDHRKAFGSIFHDLIKKNLTSISFPERIINIFETHMKKQ